MFNSLFYGERVQLLEKKFDVFCSKRFKDEFSCGVMYLLEWFDDCVDSLPVGNCSCLSGCAS